MIFIYPTVIAPIFDKYTLLPDGELKTKIEALAESVKFPLTKIYVVEGSKRSGHSNAYFYGFFKNKRIVLYDTLLSEYSPENKEEEKVESKEKVEENNSTAGSNDVAKEKENKTVSKNILQIWF